MGMILRRKAIQISLAGGWAGRSAAGFSGPIFIYSPRGFGIGFCTPLRRPAPEGQTPSRSDTCARAARRAVALKSQSAAQGKGIIRGDYPVVAANDVCRNRLAAAYFKNSLRRILATLFRIGILQRQKIALTSCITLVSFSGFV